LFSHNKKQIAEQQNNVPLKKLQLQRLLLKQRLHKKLLLHKPHKKQPLLHKPLPLLHKPLLKLLLLKLHRMLPLHALLLKAQREKLPLLQRLHV
jgi:hypothetical protein